jgi:hypothetical protein
MKLKTKIVRNFKNHPILFCVRCLLFLLILQEFAVGITWVWQLTLIQPAYAAVEYQAEHATKLTDKEYVLDQVRINGLNPDEADCIISHESGWNKDAWNVNSNGSVDLGIWQLNSVHFKNIKPSQAFDVVQATRFAIMKRIADGNWNAWYGAKSCK